MYDLKNASMEELEELYILLDQEYDELRDDISLIEMELGVIWSEMRKRKFEGVV